MIKNVLLTGGTGFIGSNLLEALLKNKYNVILLKRSTSNTKKIEPFLRLIKSYDIDSHDLEQIFENEDIDAILHVATYYKKLHDFNDIKPMFYANITFPSMLLDLAKKHNIKRFINTGTFFEYSYKNLPITENTDKTDPFNLYSMTKIAFEKILEEHVKKRYIEKAVTLKIFTPYGDKDNENKLIPFLIKGALSNKDKLQLSEGFQKLDFVYVKDIADAYIKCLNNIDDFQNDYETINIANGFPYSIREIVSVIEDILDTQLKKKWGETSGKDIDIIYADISKAADLLDWKPNYSIHEGLKATVEFYKEAIKNDISK